MERLVAIGDVHGCINTLTNLLRKISYSSQTDTLVFIGDYIDRGYYSYETVEFVRKLQRQVGGDKCICLRGNHEQLAIDALKSGDSSLWYYNGGEATVHSFDRHGHEVSEVISWFNSLPFAYDTPEIIFCHAGLSKPNLSDNTKDDLLWGRDWMERDTEAREKMVVFGHTPNRDGAAYVVPTGDICIDSACVYGGNLCALVINEDGSSECVYERKAEEDEY